MTKPNLLYVTAHIPFGRPYGARLRVLNLARLLAKFTNVSFFFCSRESPREEDIRTTQCEFDVEHVAVVKIMSQVGWEIKLRRALDRHFLGTNNFSVTSHDRAVMLDCFEKYDLIWVHHIRVANVFGVHRWPRSVIDVDDVPSQFQKSAFNAATSVRKRMVHLGQMVIWRRREKLLGERFDRIVVCSEDDRKHLKSCLQVHVIPNGFELPKVSPKWRPASPPRLGFIGTFEYDPNREGVFWFARSIWPNIKRTVPNAQLRLVGSGSKEIAAQLGPDVYGLGWLHQPDDEISSWAAMIVPLRIGGGTRVKIAEAFARKCPVVSTSLGALGYQVRSGEELLVADTEQDFAVACITLLTDHNMGRRLANRAWRMFRENLTWDSFTGVVSELVASLVHGQRKE